MPLTIAPEANVASAGIQFAMEVERALTAGNFDVFSNEEIERALTAVVRLYAAKNEGCDVPPRPITPEAATPTDVVIVVTEMLRAANLNLWDLSMWLRRSGV